MSYAEALEVQRRIQRDRIAGLAPDTLLVVEHPSTYTAGSATAPSARRPSASDLADLGAQWQVADRGGQVTWHGPGQIVIYPIVKLVGRRQDLGLYVRTLEGAIIDTLGAMGLPAGRRPGLTGVWVDDRKIASIGVRVKHWVTMHGLALNVDCDLTAFDRIDPCGMAGCPMTSVARETGTTPDRAAITGRLVGRLQLCLNESLPAEPPRQEA